MPELRELPTPPFFDPAHAGRYGYSPDPLRLFAMAGDWAREHGIRPAGSDAFRLHLLLVDAQKDFCFPEGTLYVGGRSGQGAVGDCARVAGFIHRNLRRITRITTTLDTHFAFQIFFPSFWIDREGRPLAPHRELSFAEVHSGEARPNPAVASWLCGGDQAWLRREVEHYTRELEREGKYTLYLWPPHCLLGSDGHALTGLVHEARLFHSFVRGAQSWSELKGDNPLTEHYSALRPEVLLRHDGKRLAEPNLRFLQTLLDSDAVVIAGEAASHCVKNTLEDLLHGIGSIDRTLARKFYVLTDCTSAVAVPDGKGGFLADFTPEAEAALARFAEAGMHLVRSTEPVAGWPGMPS